MKITYERFEFQGIIFRNNKEHNFLCILILFLIINLLTTIINNIVISGINIEQPTHLRDLSDKDYKL